MNVSPLLVANAQPPELIQPKRRSVLPPIGIGPARFQALVLANSEPGRCALSDPWGLVLPKNPSELPALSA